MVESGGSGAPSEDRARALSAKRSALVGVAIAATGIFIVKLAFAAWLLARGFSHISDDDFSRTVIAEGFAHAPHLDPSGTSWLPFPFWVDGTAMMIAGRSLGAARGIAVILGCLAPCAVFLALRSRRVELAPFLALAAFVAPWPAWLSIATVPEALTAGLASAAVIGLVHARPFSRRDVAFAVFLLCACLSRYEAWPMAAASAVAVAMRARHEKKTPTVALVIALVLAGPLSWLIWNEHAHGDALHFLARVSRFRQNAGQAGGGALDSWLFYPRALATEMPEICVLGAVALAGVTLDPTLRQRWRGPLFACAATLAFLVAGAARDGAPTHHPARALVIICPIIVAAGLDAARELASRKLRRGRGPRVAFALACAAVILAPWMWMSRPGSSPAESRERQVGKGYALRAKRAQSVVVTPCAYEHFALIAAFGAPERVRILPAGSGAAPPYDECPRVDVASM